MGQIRSGQKPDQYTPFLGCESIALDGDYYYNSTISDDNQDSLYLTLNVLFPRAVLYAEVIPAVIVLCDNILGMSIYCVSEEEFAEMHNSNRVLFYQKYFENFRETKKNTVCHSARAHS